MDASHRRSYELLPVTPTPWEVALADVGIPDLDGVLVVVEAGSGLPRVAGPIQKGESLLRVFLFGVTDPPDDRESARPPKLVCADETLAARLRADLHHFGVLVERVASVPHADRFTAKLRLVPGPEDRRR